VVKQMPGAPMVNVDKITYEEIHSKLTAYSLNMEHDRGRHKAVVFQSAIGAGKEHADMIAQQIMSHIPSAQATFKGADHYGSRYNALIPVTGPNGMTVDVLTAWIYDDIEKEKAIASKPRLAIFTKPRVTTIYIEEDSNAYLLP